MLLITLVLLMSASYVVYESWDPVDDMVVVSYKVIDNQWYGTYKISPSCRWATDLQKYKFYDGYTGPGECPTSGNIYFNWGETEYDYRNSILLKCSSNLGHFKLLDVDNGLVVPAELKIRLLFIKKEVYFRQIRPALSNCCAVCMSVEWIPVSQINVYFGKWGDICDMAGNVIPTRVQALSYNEYSSYVIEKAELVFDCVIVNY